MILTIPGLDAEDLFCGPEIERLAKLIAEITKE